VPGEEAAAVVPEHPFAPVREGLAGR